MGGGGERDSFARSNSFGAFGGLFWGALFTRARDVQTGLPGESEWRDWFTPRTTEREMRSGDDGVLRVSCIERETIADARAASSGARGGGEGSTTKEVA